MPQPTCLIRPINGHIPLKGTCPSIPPCHQVPLTKEARNAYRSQKDQEEDNGSTRYVYQIYQGVRNNTHNGKHRIYRQTFYQYPRRLRRQDSSTKQGNFTRQCFPLLKARLHRNIQYAIHRWKRRTKMYLNCLLKYFRPSSKDTCRSTFQ